jgi:arylsulfatase A-like enzyme
VPAAIILLHGDRDRRVGGRETQRGDNESEDKEPEQGRGSHDRSLGAVPGGHKVNETAGEKLAMRAGRCRVGFPMNPCAFGFRVVVLFLAVVVGSYAQSAPKPNVVYILADDLGYGELGSYGQKTIQTPHLDRLAAEGMRFTQFYAGNTVCAPSRSVLMTGQHMGHTRVRGNAKVDDGTAQSLTAADVTIATVLKRAGYATGIVGKWGLGAAGTAGDPRQHGFDYSYGFLNQTHAHNHYPSFLWKNGERVPLPNDLVPVGTVEGVGYATKRVAYADDLFFDEARDFIDRSRARPFFLYLALTVPHANNERSKELGDGQEVPDYGIYADKPWSDAQKGQAAMITRMDARIGELMAQLKKLGLDGKTLVIFTSDNGPHKEGGPKYDPDFLEARGLLTGLKRSMTEGGIRIPFIARWPGRIAAGKVSAHVGYFGDMMATLADLSGAPAPQNLDSISFVPELLGQGKQSKHDYLYWEFYEKGFSQAVLIGGRWKGIRLLEPSAPIQLYDLANDLGEKTDLAAKNPELVARVAEVMRTAHVDNEYWKQPAK